ncbi:MAG: glycosyltransferase [Flavobacteriaceae bacterium]|nr:glycosyltransferase [Flavobacteriaceae bacterium]
MILFAIFCLVSFIQIFYYLLIFKNLKKCNSPGDPAYSSPVSVVVCAKNEENNLKVLLPALIAQKYTHFELVLVNDHSQDDSLKFMLGFQSAQEKNGNQIKIKIIDLQEPESSGKKNALTKGILNASNENILLTDADCVPASDGWLKGMTAKLTEEKTISLGYGGYNKISGSFLNKLIRYETMLTALQYFSYAKMGKTLHGCREEISPIKKVFF